MTQEFLLKLLPKEASSDSLIIRHIAGERDIDPATVTALRVLRRSIDARGRQVFVNLKVRLYINEKPEGDVFERIEYQDVSRKPKVTVIGAGPAGLFAALRLIELGYCPVIVERGKDVRERKKDLALITKEQRVDPNSNYCFGEGGAGAYSDGKLFTRSKKRGSVEKILRVFCQHGAPLSILQDAHPHIGTDLLPRVIENMRKTIISCGGEVHFQTLFTDMLISGDELRSVVCRDMVTGDESEYPAPVILCTGHSARDVYRMLFAKNVEIEPKGLAIGVRLEHAAELIDKIQYHSPQGKGKYLPTAEYNFVTQVEGRGVYSFCMCPGGFVIPAATDKEQIVVNGMSPSNRGTRFSNSGMVVEIRPEDIREMLPEVEDNALMMMSLQEKIERDCFLQGNRRQTAPAQRMTDFVNGHLSYDLPESSYAPGLISSPLHFWLPPFISTRLRQGFKQFGRMSHGFLTKEATMIAAETRTSSPVRIVRLADTLQHVRIQGLFPAGEGAGYAGGIVSAGIDGERCSEAVLNYFA